MAKKTPETSAEKPFSLLNNLLDKIYSLKNFQSSKKVYLMLLIAGLLLLAIYKKNWFVAAVINDMPITNLELQMKLNDQFRSQTLNQLIEEKIILGEAGKNNALPTETEIDQRIQELETQVGGPQALDSLVSQQGLTRSSLRSRIRIPLAISKLYDKEATVSADEVAEFIEQNKQSLQATDSAGQQKESYDAIKNQKLTQIFSQKFQELKQKAKIVIF